MFATNEGTIDRVLRVLLGVVMLYLGWAGIVTGTWGVILQYVGFVPVLTGLIGWCPLYSLFGLNTCPLKN